MPIKKKIKVIEVEKVEEFIILMDWKEYTKKLPLARKIYHKVFPEKPKTHAEYIKQFNITGDIVETIFEYEKEESKGNQQ